MSYPRTIQPLVIEDEPKSKDYFEAVFGSLKASHSIAPPRWAFCHEDGRRLLADDRVYHLVTIDLRLPEQPGQPPAESLEFGLSLIQDCATRNAYPVPAVLVITGHLGQTSQQQLADQVRQSFAYGRVLVKSDHLEDEIDQALQFIERYCDVGIHIRDGGPKLFPTLTPREEDLLRQAVLADALRIGVDLAWWSAGYDPYSGWTKTLIGRFLLSEGRGHSLYTFFKLASIDGAGIVFREAEAMSQKLKHVKVIAAHVAGDRSLLVTQSAGSGSTPPWSLDELLSRPTADVGDDLQRLAHEIVQQVAALGDRTPDQRDRRHLLWRHHERERIETQWLRRGGEEVLREYRDTVLSPVVLFGILAADTTIVRYELQTVLHGDLNYSNVAIEDDGGRTRAFIFDASGCQPGVCIRDIAMLEVATVLHQEADERIVPACVSLYANNENVEGPEGATDRQRNTLLFVQSLREAALPYTTPDVYALMVVDHALIQLGGLAYGSAFNKIQNPQDAALLAALAANWFDSLRVGD